MRRLRVREAHLPNSIHSGSNRTWPVPDLQPGPKHIPTTLSELVGGVRSTWQEGWVKPTCPEHRPLPSASPQGTAQQLQSLGAEKEAAQKECEAFLSARPAGPAALHLPVALNNVKNKYSDVQVLCNLYGET